MYALRVGSSGITIELDALEEAGGVEELLLLPPPACAGGEDICASCDSCAESARNGPAESIAAISGGDGCFVCARRSTGCLRGRPRFRLVGSTGSCGVIVDCGSKPELAEKNDAIGMCSNRNSPCELALALEFAPSIVALCSPIAAVTFGTGTAAAGRLTKCPLTRCLFIACRCRDSCL